MVGGSAVTNENILLVAASSTGSSVFNPTNDTVAYYSNGAFWYRMSNRAFGFADSTSILLSNTDVIDPSSN